jgi:rubrerythrin
MAIPERRRIMNTFDERVKIAKERYSEEKNISNAVRLLERDEKLEPFTPREILSQRKSKANGGNQKSPERVCPSCRGRMLLSTVCPSCSAGKQGMKTVWQCIKCSAKEYSKKTGDEWIKELLS